MNSEKVKEIKKGLECCSMLMDNTKTAEEQDNSCIECPYRLNDRCSWKLDSDALTLINELESENERLILQYERVKAGSEMNCLELIDRIAELEKGNAKLLDSVETVQSNRCVFKCELTKKQLKQFGERLKDEIADIKQFFRNCLDRDYRGLTEDRIDEILKEFINEKPTK